MTGRNVPPHRYVSFRPTRRSILGGALAGAGVLAGTGLLPSIAQAASYAPRMRVIIDNDFSGDPDGLFQLAHHLASPSVKIPLIIGSHIHVKDFLDHSTTQADNAVARVQELYARMSLADIPPVIAGRNQAQPSQAASPSRAAEKIIAEALRTDTKLPLFYVAGAGLTDLAEALQREPRIARRMTLIWIGGMEYPDLQPQVPERHDPEYNLTIDLTAARTVFNDTAIPIWQIPRNVYRQMLISMAELETGLRPAGALGAYLLAQLDRVRASVKGNLGETYVLGDSPLVTLTALQSSFEPDSSSCRYIVRPTPRLTAAGGYEAAPEARPMRVYCTIDTRLTFADMFAKLSAAARQKI